MKLIGTLLLFIAATSASNQRIFGGEKAVLGQFPYQAAVKSWDYDGRGFTCGGAIVDEHWILTAAHCVSGNKDGTIIVGSLNINPTDADVQAQSIYVMADSFFVHSGYQSGIWVNDIAMIYLPEPIEFSEFVKPVELHLDSDETYVGENVNIAGWGMTTPTGASDELLYAQLKVQDLRVCQDFFPIGMDESQICVAATETQSPCPGDSGGPLVLADRDNYISIGIVSFGMDCFNGDPVGFARNSAQKKFIEDTMNSI